MNSRVAPPSSLWTVSCSRRGSGFRRLVVRQEGQQGLFAGGIKALRHGVVPAELGRALGEEFPDARQCCEFECQFDPASSGRRQLNEQRQEYRCETAGGHAVLEQPAGEIGHELREDHTVLEANAEPERHAHDQALSVVDAVLHDDLHADHEQHRQQDGDVGGGDRARDGQDNGQRFGEERERNHDDA